MVGCVLVGLWADWRLEVKGQVRRVRGPASCERLVTEERKGAGRNKEEQHLVCSLRTLVAR